MRFVSVPVPTHARSRAALAARWLTPEEEALCPRRAVEKRRAEFTAGRIAAKLAVSRLRGASPTDPESWIGVAEGHASGRPIVVNRSGSPVADVALSITHSDGVAIAAAAREGLGIDLVPIEDRGGAFGAEAFAPGEVEAWSRWMPAGENVAFAQSIAFGAKEAVLKWLGVGLRMSLRQLVVRPAQAARAIHCHDLQTLALGLRLDVAFGDDAQGSRTAQTVSLRSWVMRVANQLLIVASSDDSYAARRAASHFAG
jgi:4'-phosphopantetheinyl transferase EntD